MKIELAVKEFKELVNEYGFKIVGETSRLYNGTPGKKQGELMYTDLTIRIGTDEPPIKGKKVL